MAVYGHAKKNSTRPFMTVCALGYRPPWKMNGHTPLSARDHLDQNHPNHQSRLLVVAPRRVLSPKSHHSWSCRSLCLLATTMTTADFRPRVISTIGFNLHIRLRFLYLSSFLSLFLPVVFLFGLVAKLFMHHIINDHAVMTWRSSDYPPFHSFFIFLVHSFAT